MIVNCPNCNKQISSQAALCSHCGFAVGSVSDEEFREYKRRKLRDRLYHLKMTSYAVISAFLAAFGWYWWDSSGFQEASTRGPVLALAVCAVAYLVVRIFLFLARRKMRKLLTSGIP